jgi:hypothetical protein
LPFFVDFFAFVFFAFFFVLFFAFFFMLFFMLFFFRGVAELSIGIGSIGIDGSGAIGVGGGKSGSIIPGPLQPLSIGEF